ncbi:MAG TPA: type II toxin-antitoxin system RelE/ParE family toxin [Acetobacteraceae bacterium]|nr:type II toxin-antitoxin system RelE/ParE family toxin [Acetobacteraceae bacterium]
MRRVLILLDRCRDSSALDTPGYRLYPLRGDREGQWAATFSGNWRLIFEFENGHAMNVDLVDYH